MYSTQRYTCVYSTETLTVHKRYQERDSFFLEVDL